jgi:hypothetical protein
MQEHLNINNMNTVEVIKMNLLQSEWSLLSFQFSIWSNADILFTYVLQ